MRGPGIGQVVTRDAIPFLRRVAERVRRGVSELGPSLIDGSLEERLQRVTREVAPHGIDPFGWDPAYARFAVGAGAVLSRSYFRTIVHGIEHLPPGRFLLVANHGGQIPIDGLIVAISVFLEGEPPRLVRAMVEKWSQTLPFVSSFFAKCGQVVGVPENARWLLERDQALLVFPEGTAGLAKTFQHRYELTEFGLGFMRLALATGTPIVPVSVVGSEEQYISVANLHSVAKALHMPSFPVIPQLFVPGGQLPLPTRYRLDFGPPLHFSGDSEDDDAIIEEKVWVVKATLQSMLNKALAERTSLFF